jgi:Tyrosine-protein kinase ephrin type A/B receptor-like
MNTYSAAAADICVPCAAGSYSGLGESQCHSCCSGQYFDPKLKECISCMAGYYTPNAGQECKKCPCMTYSAAKESVCHDCPPGTKINADQTGCDKTEECSRGYILENGKCVCKAGSSVTTDGKCEICEEDYYSEQDGATECVICRGYVNVDRTVCHQVTDCYPGYTLSYDHLRCTCEAGSYIIARDRRCKRCLEGTYSTKAGSTECLPCAGRVTDGGTQCAVATP